MIGTFTEAISDDKGGRNTAAWDRSFWFGQYFARRTASWACLPHRRRPGFRQDHPGNPVSSRRSSQRGANPLYNFSRVTRGTGVGGPVARLRPLQIRNLRGAAAGAGPEGL